MTHLMHYDERTEWPYNFGPDVMDVAIRDGLPALTILRNGKELSSRTTGAVVVHLRERGLPSATIVVNLRESVGANAVTLAEWICRALGDYARREV